jgi:hypothetical protein
MKNDGGPAYPTKLGMSGYGNTLPMDGPRGVEWVEIAHGMTLRDYFAGQAMGYILDKSATVTDAAKLAYRYADAMIEERAQ